MIELELLLAETGATVEWPATPDLTPAVLARIAPRMSAPRRIRIRRPLAIALAALLVVAAGAAAIPGIRNPVFDWLGLRSAKVERVPRLPLKPAPGAKLALGERTTLAAATPQLGFHPLVARALRAPAVYLDRSIPGGELSLVYRDGKLVLYELSGRLRREFFQKMVGPGTRIERVTVAGAPGLWIHGAAHEIVYLDRTGAIRPETVRLVGDVLLWRHGDLLLRLEGARSRAEALRIASSVRAAP